jgi:hypothetical protein
LTGSYVGCGITRSWPPRGRQLRVEEELWDMKLSAPAREVRMTLDLAGRGVTMLGVAVMLAVSLLAGGCVSPAEPQADSPFPAPASPNHPPTISSLAADRGTILPFDICELLCVALDEDGDELSYVWSAAEGYVYDEGDSAYWEAPDTEGIYHVRVVVSDGNGGEAGDSTSIVVRENTPPQIDSLSTDEHWLVPGSSCFVKCVASDDDGDALSYEWWTEDGEMYGEGPVVAWIAPQLEGLYKISVVVADHFGGECGRSLAASVALAEPPNILGLIASSDEPKFLKEFRGGYRILQGKDCLIECVVAGADSRLNYRWVADHGVISGTGPVVAWEAPTSRCQATIAVVVSDSVGNVASKDVVFQVETCACGFN